VAIRYEVIAFEVVQGVCASIYRCSTKYGEDKANSIIGGTVQLAWKLRWFLHLRFETAGSHPRLFALVEEIFGRYLDESGLPRFRSAGPYSCSKYRTEIGLASPDP
jgi:hypothetical protein